MKLNTCLSVLSVIAAAYTLPAAAQISGSVQATLASGTVQGNIFASKTQVFLTAGPANQKTSGLSDGKYYFQVTDPSGSTLLSNDPAACRQVVINGGRLAGAYDPIQQALEPAGSPLDAVDCEHASAVPTGNSLSAAAVQVGGAIRDCSFGASGPDVFCNSPNPGGEYKLWLIAQSNAVSKCNPAVNPDGFTLKFDRGCALTDNFKTALPAISHVAVCAFNDINGNGVLDPGELMISGWPITATAPVASYVTLQSDTQSGASVTATTDSSGCVSFGAAGIPTNTPVTVTLTEANLTGWTQTAPANGTYDASGKPALTGPAAVSGGIISVTLGPGAVVTAPKFANTNPQCPDCSILGTMTVLNTATPQKLYTWDITKSVDKTEIDDVAPGGSALFNYTVSVTHDSGTGSFLTGTITLINADGGKPSTALNVADAVSNGGVCTVKDPVSGLYVSQVLNLALNAFTETNLQYRCAYAAAPSSPRSASTATATNVSDPSLQYSGAAQFDFSAASAIADGSVSITDTLGGALGAVSYTDPSPKTFSYPHTFTGDPSGTCTNHSNTASLTSATTGTTASASQSVKVCVKSPISTVTITGTATPSAATVAGDQSINPVTLKDSATISGGTNPTGTITFTLTRGGKTLDTETVSVKGNGTYTTPLGYLLTSLSPGVLQWSASYSGDAVNSSASESGSTAEQVTVASLGLKYTGADDNGDITEFEPSTPSAILTGATNPTGTLTFTLSAPFDPSITPCTRTVTVNGNGTYTASSACTPNDAFVAYWTVSYSGDAQNAARTFHVEFDVRY